MQTLTEANKFRKLCSLGQPLALLAGVAIGIIAFEIHADGERHPASWDVLPFMIIGMLIVSDAWDVLSRNLSFIVAGRKSLVVYYPYTRTRVFVSMRLCAGCYPYENRVLLSDGRQVFMNSVLFHRRNSRLRLRNILLERLDLSHVELRNKADFTLWPTDLIHLLCLGLVGCALLLNTYVNEIWIAIIGAVLVVGMPGVTWILWTRGGRCYLPIIGCERNANNTLKGIRHKNGIR